jgi:arsenical pump membrane protein
VLRSRVRRPAEYALIAGVAGAVVARIAWPSAASSAFRQAWPPFALVAGLLLVGSVAQHDGVLESAGDVLARLPGGPIALYAALMALVAVVTAVLNLDTSVVFLTPVVIAAARRSGLSDVAFLYGVVFLSNSASLLLPGSNLTNLIVLSDRASGLAFAERMWPAWVAASVVTAAVVALVHRSALRGRRTRTTLPRPRPGWIGVIGAGAAAGVVLVVRAPAVPVLALGVVVVVASARADVAEARRIAGGIDVTLLLGLFGIAVAIGALARVWGAPGDLMASAGPWASSSIAAAGSAAVNNLPAAVALASRSPLHPDALLIGLDVGPNLVIWGSLAGVLWYTTARSVGAEPSAATYSKLGVLVALTSIAAAMLALGFVPPRT